MLAHHHLPEFNHILMSEVDEQMDLSQATDWKTWGDI